MSSNKKMDPDGYVSPPGGRGRATLSSLPTSGQGRAGQPPSMRMMSPGGRGRTLPPPPPIGTGSPVKQRPTTPGAAGNLPWLSKQYDLPEGFNPNDSNSSFFDAPSATAGYDDFSRVRILADENAKPDSDEATTRSAQEKLEKELRERGMRAFIEVDEEKEIKKPTSEISMGNESYILDLAQQKETREKDLREEALHEALILYKKSLEDGGPDDQNVFLAFFSQLQKELRVKFQEHYDKQDERLNQALQDELQRREMEGTLDDDEEVAADSKGAKSARVGQFIKKNSLRLNNGSLHSGYSGNSRHSDNKSAHSSKMDPEGPSGKQIRKEMRQELKDDPEGVKSKHLKKAEKKQLKADGSDKSLVSINLKEASDREIEERKNIEEKKKKQEAEQEARQEKLLTMEEGVEDDDDDDEKKRATCTLLVGAGIFFALLFDVIMIILIAKK